MPETLVAERAPGPAAGAAGLSVIVIDDDLLSREVLSVLAEGAGLHVATFESGEEALLHLGSRGAPDAVITDIQMPGLRGVELARRLRATCGPGTRLLAMSGSEAPDAVSAAYDGFLLKPFSMTDLTLALQPGATGRSNAGAAQGLAAQGLAARGLVTQGLVTQGLVTQGEEVWQEISRTTYDSLLRSMPAVQVKALFTMCLDDAEQRIPVLRSASAAGDQARFVAAAHAIKGGCSMVGARSLAAMAARMEKEGLSGVDDSTPIEDFVAALARVRVMLVTHRAFSGNAPD